MATGSVILEKAWVDRFDFGTSVIGSLVQPDLRFDGHWFEPYDSTVKDSYRFELYDSTVYVLPEAWTRRLLHQYPEMSPPLTLPRLGTKFWNHCWLFQDSDLNPPSTLPRSGTGTFSEPAVDSTKIRTWSCLWQCQDTELHSGPAIESAKIRTCSFFIFPKGAIYYPNLFSIEPTVSNW